MILNMHGNVVNPETASEYAHIMFDIKNAEKINKKNCQLIHLV